MEAELRLKSLEERLAAAEEAKAAYAHLFNAIDEGFRVVEVLFNDTGEAIDYIFLQVNAAFVAQTGLRGEQTERICNDRSTS